MRSSWRRRQIWYQTLSFSTSCMHAYLLCLHSAEKAHISSRLYHLPSLKPAPSMLSFGHAVLRWWKLWTQGLCIYLACSNLCLGTCSHLLLHARCLHMLQAQFKALQHHHYAHNWLQICWRSSSITLPDMQVATMGTRRKLSVSVNSCGICAGVLKVSPAVLLCGARLKSWQHFAPFAACLVQCLRCDGVV